MVDLFLLKSPQGLSTGHQAVNGSSIGAESSPLFAWVTLIGCEALPSLSASPSIICSEGFLWFVLEYPFARLHLAMLADRVARQELRGAFYIDRILSTVLAGRRADFGCTLCGGQLL